MTQLWDPECSPFNATATGWLGKQRDTMLANVLLKRTEIGKPLSKAFQNPPIDRIYGTRELQPYDAKNALQGWMGCEPVGVPHLPAVKSARQPKDFKQLNRSAVNKGIVDAGCFRTFAKSHTAKLIARAEMKSASVKAGIVERPPPAQPPPNLVHGIKNQPHEPMDAVLKHAYKDQWIKDVKIMKVREDLNMTKQVPKTTKKVNYKQWYPNRTSMLRTVMPPIGVSAPPWRMPRFLKKAKPHLSTFRSEKDMLSQIQANAFDHVCRTGSRGQGVYTQPTNFKMAMETSKLEQGCRVCPT